MTDAQLDVDPAELISAAGRLDGLADRLEQSLGASAPALTVHAAGRDEVSETSARSFNAVAETFATDSARGVEELRKIAAVLRAQATGYRAGDDDAASAIRSANA
ncbi:PE family protein [Gordonia sp. SL306]|uniref:PE family protein n=1 Tax=Gordonia sp. SL306 TaxID=2995145 RepID=UPI002271E3D7|nr:PE family protein [Gordonia sp. SL306]WAC56416.1 PE family protein [Gordonia sp. SL306]